MAKLHFTLESNQTFVGPNVQARHGDVLHVELDGAGKPVDEHFRDAVESGVAVIVPEPADAVVEAAARDEAQK